MIAPDGAVESEALRLRRAGSANGRWRRDAMASIEPAIDAPGQAVEKIMARFFRPTVERHLRSPVRLVVAVTIRNEQQIRRVADPDSAPADGHPGDMIAPGPKDGALVMTSVIVRVLKDQDPVLGPVLPFFVGIGLRHPEPAPGVQSHRHRLTHIRFTSKKGRVESLRHGDRLGGVSRNGGSLARCLGIARHIVGGENGASHAQQSGEEK